MNRESQNISFRDGIEKKKGNVGRRLLVVCITLLCVVVGGIILVVCIKRYPTRLYIKQSSSGSAGKYWNYELSTDEVIKEIKYEKNFLGTEQSWTFEQIGAGEVTITWKAYESGVYYEPNSYGITYYFNDQGEYKVIKDTREDK